MKDKGRYAEVPSGDYPPIEQACVIVSSSQNGSSKNVSAKNKETARQFLSFVKTAAVADVLRSYGFDVPVGSAR
jgi:ABC-type molybdate transport system substrate-binding protein